MVVRRPQRIVAAFECREIGDDGRPTSPWFQLARTERPDLVELDEEHAKRVQAGERIEVVKPSGTSGAAALRFVGG